MPKALALWLGASLPLSRIALAFHGMIVGIDETGGFSSADSGISFFGAVQLRQRRALHRAKLNDFAKWEAKLPRSLKDHKGEIKGNALTDSQLAEFVERIVRGYPPLLITPVGMRSKDNPPPIIDKHRHVQWVGIGKGAEWYAAHDRKELANTYQEFAHWFRKLSYEQYMKVRVLGECIVHAIINAFGHSVTGGYDLELPRLRFTIDRDLVRNPHANIFWLELMRNQLYSITKRHPVPFLNTWEKKGHPVLKKFSRDGQLDMNELFWKQLEFAASHQTPELRIADHVAVIFGRYFNRREASAAYQRLRPCIAQRQTVTLIAMEDFDVDSWVYDDADNPWASEG